MNCFSDEKVEDGVQPAVSQEISEEKLDLGPGRIEEEAVGAVDPTEETEEEAAEEEGEETGNLAEGVAEDKISTTR